VTRLVVALVLLATAAAGGWLWLRADAPRGEADPALSRFDEAFARGLAELSELPAYREELEGLPQGELRDAIQALAARGMRRLGDEQLATRTRIVGRMLQGLDTATCAAMATGQQNEAVHDAAVLVLDPDSLEAWVELSFAAARAELEQRPLPPQSYPQVQSALQAVAVRLSQAEAERLSRALSNLAEQPPAEACWAARNLYQVVPRLDPPASTVLARELAGP